MQQQPRQWGSVTLEAQSQLRALRDGTPSDDVLTAVRTLITVARGLVEAPEEPRRHRIRASNPQFFRRVGRLRDAAAVVRTMGFAEQQGQGQEQVQEYFVAPLGIGVGAASPPQQVLEVLQRAVPEIEADIVESELAQAAARRRQVERRERKRAASGRYAMQWAMVGGGSGAWRGSGGGGGGGMQALPRHSSGFVGLRNQGATCYLNSLLQCLYHNALLRSALWSLEPPPSGSEATPMKIQSSLRAGGGMKVANAAMVPGALRELFRSMARAPQTVDTAPLTKAFGWRSADVVVQQDAHELLLLLLDILEEQLTGAAREGLRQTFACVQCNVVRWEHEGVARESVREEACRVLGLDLPPAAEVDGAQREGVASGGGAILFPATVCGVSVITASHRQSSHPASHLPCS
jgi:hypothetical protein